MLKFLFLPNWNTCRFLSVYLCIAASVFSGSGLMAQKEREGATADASQRNKPLGGQELEDHVSTGDLNYETLRFYEKAIPQYEAALAKKPKNPLVRAKLADCYRYTNEMANATVHFAEAFKSANQLPAHFRLSYGQVMMALGRYEEAKKQFQEYTRTDSTRARQLIRSCDFARNAQFAAPRYVVRPEEAVNGPEADFGPVLYGDEVFYLSFQKNKPEDDWCQLYRSKPDAAGRLTPMGRLNDRVENTDRAFVTFSADRRTVFYAKHQLRNGIRFIGNTDMPQLLLGANASNILAWTEVKRLKINKDGYSFGYPALSANGQILYFASDMPGGQGGMDIWMCARSGDDWGIPQNLGKPINTPGDEISPFVAADGTLYFASDWHVGFGGLDLFFAKPNGKTFQQPQNMGVPVNSGYDDFCLVETSNGKHLYFTSNRPGGKGREDIYGATKTAPSDPTAQAPPAAEKGREPEKYPAKPAPQKPDHAARTLIGTVRDATTKIPVVGAFVQLTDPKTNKKTGVYTDAQGAYQLSMRPKVAYQVLVSAQGYVEINDTLTAPDLASLPPFALVPVLKRNAPANPPAPTAQSPAVPPKGNPEPVTPAKGPEPVKPTPTTPNAASETFVTLYPHHVPATTPEANGRLPQPVAKNPRGGPKEGENSPGTTYFRVQLGAFKDQYPGIFSDLNDLGNIELSEDRTNKINYYFIGPYADLATAQSIRDAVVLRGIRDAFIVAFQNGKRVKITQAVSD